MRKQKSCKPLLYLLLTGWCFLFLRCESTEKSMVRAVYLSQTGQGYQAGLLYQAPQAAADAAGQPHDDDRKDQKYDDERRKNVCSLFFHCFPLMLTSPLCTVRRSPFGRRSTRP